jgi:translocation and assembly module TamA
MRRLPRRLSLLLLPWMFLVLPAHAGVQLTVDGVDDNLKSAVVSAVELSQYGTRSVSDAQIRRLYENAPDQATSALKPYGYYDATVTGDLKQVGKDWQVTLHVKPGEPVKVTRVELSLDKAATDIGAINRARRAIERLRGKPGRAIATAR